MWPLLSVCEQGGVPDVANMTELGRALDAPVGPRPPALALHLVVEELGDVGDVGDVVLEHLDEAASEEAVHPPGVGVHGLRDGVGVHEGGPHSEHRDELLCCLLGDLGQLSVEGGGGGQGGGGGGQGALRHPGINTAVGP